MALSDAFRLGQANRSTLEAAHKEHVDRLLRLTSRLRADERNNVLARHLAQQVPGWFQFCWSRTCRRRTSRPNWRCGRRSSIAMCSAATARRRAAGLRSGSSRQSRHAGRRLDRHSRSCARPSAAKSQPLRSRYRKLENSSITCRDHCLLRQLKILIHRQRDTRDQALQTIQDLGGDAVVHLGTVDLSLNDADPLQDPQML